jgi:uncharacterized membrane protein YgcG
MKISWYTWIVMSLALSAIALSYGYFYNWKPKMAEAEATNAYAEALRAAANQQPQANDRVKTAEKMRNEAVQQWAAFVATNTPGTSLRDMGIDISVNQWQLAIDSQKFRNSIQLAVNHQVKAGGVKVVNGPLIPTADQNANTILSSFYNYPAIPFPVLIFDLGTVTVQGTYKQIMDNMAAWTKMPHYLAVADGLAITGTSPTLTGTYNLTLVGYIRGNVVSIPVPEGAAPANRGIGGGGGGGGTAPGGGGAGGFRGGGTGPGGKPGPSSGPHI